MQREIIKFDIDRPQVVRLDLSEGKEVTSKAGSKQWQYTVDRNQGIMWLPLAGRQAIERCGAQAGDQVKILKTLLGKQTVFTAQVIPDEPQKPATLAVPALRANGHLAGERLLSARRKPATGAACCTRASSEGASDRGFVCALSRHGCASELGSVGRGPKAGVRLRSADLGRRSYVREHAVHQRPTRRQVMPSYWDEPVWDDEPEPDWDCESLIETEDRN